jgi:signal transduction histidine kinase/CheY-like chemotaxis protein
LQRRPIVATHIQQSDDPRVQLVRSFGIRAYACNPLLVNDQVLGTLSFASRSKDQFDAEDLDLLQTVSHYVTLAHERMRLVQQLRLADRRKDEFLATLAHELRNPLAPVRNAIQVLQLKGPPVPELQWARDVIDRQMQQMTRLIDDLLDVSRISRGKIELRRERVNLVRVVQGAVETSRPLIEEQGHELKVALSPEPVFLDADVTRLAQVFGNLLTNAAKYTGRGGRIDLTAERQGSEVVVSVKDTGIGIPVGKLQSIFEMFAQVEGALGRSQGGLGIGLSLAERLVEMHGGSITAHSDGPGRGSEFVVRLPVAVERPDDPPVGEDDGRPAATPRLRILVVDDNRDGAESLGLMLQILGHDVRTAYDGAEAVQAAGDYRPDVVLLDIGLPKLNGYDACRRIRERSWGRNMAVVAVTGWGQDEDKQRSKAAGFDRHLVKPVSVDALVNLLAELQPAVA